MSKSLNRRASQHESGIRRSKRSKSNLIQHSNKAFSFFFAIKEEKLETVDEIMTKALALGGEVVEEAEDADFIISNRFDEELSSCGLMLSEKFIEESYSNGTWIGDVSAFTLSSSESSRKKQKKSKYSEEEIQNMMNYIYQHNNKSFDIVEEELFEEMALTLEFEGRSAVGLSRKFSQLSKNTLKSFLASKEQAEKILPPVSNSTTAPNESISILDSLIGSIEEVPPSNNPTLIEEGPPEFSSTPQSAQFSMPQISNQVTKNPIPEDSILQELKSELTKDQIFSFMCEIIGCPIIENKCI